MLSLRLETYLGVLCAPLGSVEIYNVGNPVRCWKLAANPNPNPLQTGEEGSGHKSASYYLTTMVDNKHL